MCDSLVLVDGTLDFQPRGQGMNFARATTLEQNFVLRFL